jgi:hypothetical protein
VDYSSTMISLTIHIITLTQATSITPATNAFIKTPINHSIGSDWAATAIDRNGSLRIAAWADGGVNATRVAPRFLSSQTLPV